MLTLLLIGILTLTILFSYPLRVDALFEEWVPYVPHVSQVELDYWKENGTSYIDISIEFPSTGHNISDWRTPIIVGNNISVDAEIWRWTGYDFPMVITVSHTYNLGNLSAGQYLFTFKAWGFPLKNTTFTVSTIVPDDYPTIQEAINSANEGDTVFVRNGTYFENVVVNKTVSLIGEDRNTTVIDGNQTGTVVKVTEDNVTIEGFTIQNGEVGLDLNSNNNTVASNKFRSNGLQETDKIADLEIHQDTPTSPVWRFLYDLIDGSYTEFLDLTTETPILGVKAFGHSDVVELLLGLFHDANEDSVPQLNEFAGFASRGHEVWGYIFDPPKGRYIIKIRGNNVTGNPGHFDREIIKFKGYGIGVHHSSNSVFAENLITENHAGLYFQSCSSMTVRMNEVTRNSGGIIGGNLTDSTIYANKIHHNNSSDAFSIGILLRTSKSINLTNNQLSFNTFGISLWNSSYINVIENEFYSHVGSSIGLHASSDNNIVNNNISKVSVLDGIRLMFSSGNNLERNDISEIEHSGILLWYDCFNNSAIDNNIQLSGIQGVSHGHGIEVLLSSNNVFADNVISHSRVQGIILIEASNNNFTGNLISSNWDGIILWSCSENRVYHNNIVDNSGQQAYDDTDGNFWDNGYPDGGNYWSDYTNQDFYKGPNQDEAGSDGIWDNSYVIDADNTDRYPLTKPYGGSHDIGIRDVTPSKTVVGQGYSMSINVTIINYGVNIETFNVTAYANTTIIAAFTNVTLTSRNSTTITFTWSTTDVAKGNYTITAKASIVPFETDTTDNTLTDGTVLVTIPGDVDGDGHVFLYDAVKIGARYGAKKGDPRYDANCDINDNGQIFLYDAVIVGAHYGQKYP